MLNREMLKFRRRDGDIRPLLIKPDDPKRRAPAESLLALYNCALQNHWTRRELDDYLEPLLKGAADSKFAAGLNKLLADRTTFQAADSGDFRERRRKLFHDSMAAFIAADGDYRRFREELPEAFVRDIYGDLPEYETVISFRNLSPDELLNRTEVLLWWGHCAHDRVADELVEKIRLRILSGMGLIVLHSGHYSKIFRRMMGTSCRLRWREVGEKERLRVVATGHPIVEGVPETFALPHSEMYGERFDLPDDGKIIFMSWFEGGDVFRSGMLFQRDAGKIFYFSPGHETYAIYHDANIQRVIANAIRFVAPAAILPPRVTPCPEPSEPIRTPNPLSSIDTSALHQKQ